jgi:hypothetical protein
MENELRELLLSRTGLLLLIGAVLLCVHSPLALALGAVLVFTAFDILGYQNASALVPYRVMQATIQFVLGAYLYAIAPAACWGFLIVWISLGCDILYYWAVRQDLCPFVWFDVSPVVFLFKHVLGRAAPIWAVRLSAGVGLGAMLWLTL